MQLEVLPDREALADRATELIAEAAVRAIAERGQFVFAVSGGSTPRRLLELLRERDDIEWNRTHIFQVDERVAPEGDADRNATMLAEALLTPEFTAVHQLAGLWLMPVEQNDLEAAAAEYATIMDEVTGSPVVFDLIQLGLGDDGHTASLVPGDPILVIDDRDVALTDEYKGRVRMSFTWPVLDRAKEQLWVVSGEGKRDALALYLANDPTIPATLATQARATVLVDAAAR
jgi:6-phosphogluconolactonase